MRFHCIPCFLKAGDGWNQAEPQGFILHPSSLILQTLHSSIVKVHKKTTPILPGAAPSAIAVIVIPQSKEGCQAVFPVPFFSVPVFPARLLVYHTRIGAVNTWSQHP